MENKNTFSAQDVMMNATRAAIIADAMAVEEPAINEDAAEIPVALPPITPRTKLGELLDMLGLKPGQRRKGATPTRVKLLASGSEPIAQMRGITLFRNGYALYENGFGRYSIVWLPYCVKFTYKFNKLRDAEKDYLRETAEITEEQLLNTKWAAAVALWGEERITQHLNRGIGNAETTDDTDDEDADLETEEEDEDTEGKNFVWDDETLGVDPLDAVIRRETREAILAEMTDKQREVFVLYHKYGWTQQQIADRLGISKMSVCERLSHAKKKVSGYMKKNF